MNILVTGASTGIGKAIANAFAAENNTVYICARNEAALQQTADELQQQFPASHIYARQVDLSRLEQVTEFVDWIRSSGASIDVLVNNAGQYLPGSIHGEEEGLLQKMLDANLFSAYHLTRKIIPLMIEQKSGHIFNICSIASLQAYPNGGSYSISKFALMGFTKNLREELKPNLIKVTGVYPGAVLTESWGDFDNSTHRIMDAQDVAAMVLSASKLSIQAVVEDIVLRPQLGDL